MDLAYISVRIWVVVLFDPENVRESPASDIGISAKLSISFMVLEQTIITGRCLESLLRVNLNYYCFPKIAFIMPLTIDNPSQRGTISIEAMNKP